MTRPLRSPGFLERIVLEEEMPLQDYGCFLPQDPFAVQTRLRD